MHESMSIDEDLIPLSVREKISDTPSSSRKPLVLYRRNSKHAIQTQKIQKEHKTVSRIATGVFTIDDPNLILQETSYGKIVMAASCTKLIDLLTNLSFIGTVTFSLCLTVADIFFENKFLF